MFCKKCGTKNEDSYKFCVNCGNPIDSLDNLPSIKTVKSNYEKYWWYRLLKVVYIFFYLQIIWIAMAVWGINSSRYVSNYPNSYYEDTYAEASWYSILSVVLFIVVIKLIKISILYIISAQKPEWKKELKRLY